jgi:DNA-binding FadR family transcriptional regulator
MHRKLYEHVEEDIGLRIFKGEYKPKESLPNEEELCTEFSLSRGVIREAVKVLSKKGLVWPRPKIGTQVQPETQWNLFDADVLVWKLKAGQQLRFLKKVTEVRMIIESEAAKLSAERARLTSTTSVYCRPPIRFTLAS